MTPKPKTPKRRSCKAPKAAPASGRPHPVPEIASFEATDGGAFGDLLTARAKAAPLRVGLLGLGYFEYWRMYPKLRDIVEDDLRKVAARLREELSGFELVYPGMVDTLDRAAEAGAAFDGAGVDALVIVEGTYVPDFITLHAVDCCRARPETILFSTQTGSHLCATDDYMATMRNSALIGLTQLTGSLRKMKVDYRAVVGEVTSPRPYREIRELLCARAAVKRLRHHTYGLVGHVFRGMYDLEFDRAKVKGFLGPEVMTIQAQHLLDCWAAAPEAQTAKAAQALLTRFKSKKIDVDDVKRSCRVGLAMRGLCRKFNLDGLCFLGQHYIEKITGAPARMGASMLMEEDGVMVSCEGDIGGLVMMQLLREFTGSLPLQAEWGQFDLAHNAVFLLGHGIATPSMAASDDHVTLTCAPEEWGFKGSGLNYEMILKPGPVTMGHFLSVGESWQMLASRGEALSFPCLPCDEIHALVRVKTPVQQYLKAVLDAGVAHHLVVAHGDALNQLCRAADLMRIQTVVVE